MGRLPSALYENVLHCKYRNKPKELQAFINKKNRYLIEAQYEDIVFRQ